MKEKIMRSVRLTIVLTALTLGSFFAGSKALFAQSQGDASREKDARTSVVRKEEAVAQLQKSTAERLALEVSFEEGVDAAELRKTVGTSGVKVKSLLYKWGEHRAGYDLKDGQTLDEALEDFGKSHVEFLQRQINNLSSPSDKAALRAGSPEQADLERSRQELLDEFSAQLALSQEKGLVLSGFIAEDAPSGLSRLLKSLPVNNLSLQINRAAEDDLDSKSEGNSREEMFSVKNPSATTSTASTGAPYGEGEQWKFTPSRGQIIYDSKTRFFTSYFSWEDVSGFNSLHFGYEHDITIFTDNKGDFKFVGNNWNSNLPEYALSSDGRPAGSRRYKDDTLFDDKALFTIGTGAATAIKIGTTYYVDIPVTVQNEKAGPTTGVVAAQLSSWAGEYDAGDPKVSESDEKAYCLLRGGKDYSHCMFSDQHFTLVNYYNDTGVYRNFPFDYRVSSSFNWNKSYIPTPPQISCPQGKYRAEYRNSASQNRSLTFARCEDGPINYNWGDGNPGNGVLNDNFEVEWSGQFNVAEGLYRLIATSDDTMQVYVDNNLVIDSSAPHAEREDRVERFISGGLHTFLIKYKEVGGKAVAKFRTEFLGNTAGCIASVASGRWKGEYFNNLTLSGSPMMVRDDSATNGSTFFAHDWGAGSPSSGCHVNSDNFSVRWTRRQQFDAGRYRFTLRMDDGVRLYVDNALRLDRWVDQGPENRSVEVDLTAGQHDLRVEYYEHIGGAVAQIYWERTGGGTVPPTISKYTWDSTPKDGQPFSGGVLGTGFVVSGTRVFFCAANTNNCYEHPQAGVAVSTSTNLRVTNVKLSGGSWQMYVQTSAGTSVRSDAFTVQSPPPSLPTIDGYSWSTTPTAGRSFSGTVTGSGFVSGNTQVWFCINGSTACYQHPSVGVNVNSLTSLSISNVNLDVGSWQMYLKTPAGQSSRSSAFIVQAPPPARPTITGYAWSSNPKAGESFGGTVNGTGFVSGGTQVYFCLSGTNTCYQHPSAGVSVNSPTRLTVTNANLSSGAWQFYVTTSAGQSDRSSSFAVQMAAPTISGYFWSTTPLAGQSFGGTVTGSNFILGGTQVWFCVAGTNTCYQHPSAGVTVNSLTNLAVSSVKLGAGSWQVYVQTYAGASSRSSAFTVR
jgi:hypothetical protein